MGWAVVKEVTQVSAALPAGAGLPVHIERRTSADSLISAAPETGQPYGRRTLRHRQKRPGFAPATRTHASARGQRAAEGTPAASCRSTDADGRQQFCHRRRSARPNPLRGIDTRRRRGDERRTGDGVCGRWRLLICPPSRTCRPHEHPNGPYSPIRPFAADSLVVKFGYV